LSGRAICGSNPPQQRTVKIPYLDTMFGKSELGEPDSSGINHFTPYPVLGILILALRLGGKTRWWSIATQQRNSDNKHAFEQRRQIQDR
jgi:hypothetical protein